MPCGSPPIRGPDTHTKRQDYEAAGVAEYWLIDPQRGALQSLVLSEHGYREAACLAEAYESAALPGFVLDLAAIRRLF